MRRRARVRIAVTIVSLLAAVRLTRAGEEPANAALPASERTYLLSR